MRLYLVVFRITLYHRSALRITLHHTSFTIILHCTASAIILYHRVCILYHPPVSECILYRTASVSIRHHPAPLGIRATSR